MNPPPKTRRPTPESSDCAKQPKNGSRCEVGGAEWIHYDGYWIRYYAPPSESLAEKKKLIDSLTRRAFHHTEAGINTPGERLEMARQAYQEQTNPARKRVNAAMLAGALFNRATDIFTRIVEFEEVGVKLSRDNELMKQCEECFTEALSLSSHVRHYSGEEGVDELWGEPLKVFSMSIADYYHSRYRKIAQAMRDIDRIGDELKALTQDYPALSGAQSQIRGLINIAKRECEVFKSDPDYYQIWPEFVAIGEQVNEFTDTVDRPPSPDLAALALLRAGKDLIVWIASVRVPMPVSMQSYLTRCADYRREAPPAAHNDAPGDLAAAPPRRMNDA